MRPILPAGSPDALVTAAQALAAGALVVIPTDTVYGIAARPDHPEALAAVFQAKVRPDALALPILAASVEQASSLGVLEGLAEVLANAFWPGPLTMVVERRLGFRAHLGGDPATVGIRVPAHNAVRTLLAVTGPLATTSANRSGEPTPATAEGVWRVFGDGVAVYLDGGTAPGGTPSTVVSLVGGSIALLREGSITLEQLLAEVRPR